MEKFFSFSFSCSLSIGLAQSVVGVYECIFEFFFPLFCRPLRVLVASQEDR